MSGRRGTPAGLGLVLAGLLGTGALGTLGACSGDDDGGDGEASVTTVAPGDGEGACDLLSVDEVTALFGTDAETATPPGAAGTTCLWQAVAEDGTTPAHQLQLSLYSGGEPLDPASFGDGAEPIDGLGDDAFVVEEGNLGTVAGVQEGDRGIVLLYATLGDPATSTSQADAVVELLRAVADRAG